MERSVKIAARAASSTSNGRLATKTVFCRQHMRMEASADHEIAAIVSALRQGGTAFRDRSSRPGNAKTVQSGPGLKKKNIAITHRARLASRDLSGLLGLLLLLLLGLLGLRDVGRRSRRGSLLALGRGATIDSGLSRLLRLGALLLLRLGGLGLAVGSRGGRVSRGGIGRLALGLGLLVLIARHASSGAFLQVSD